jgi:hypothetical protein
MVICRVWVCCDALHMFQSVYNIKHIPVVLHVAVYFK